MAIEVEPKHPFACHGKFFTRNGEKIFFKATRFNGLKTPLNFEAKLSLLKRLDKLKAAHTTGLLLAQEHADAVLDLASQAGLPALVELEVARDELLNPAAMRAAIERIGHLLALFTGRAGLAGYIINCSVEQDAIRAHGLERVRRSFARLIARIRECDDRALVAVRHRADTQALALLDEDFIYADVPPLDPVELREYLLTLHNIAEARPLVVEFGNASPGQDEAVEVAFGSGAAGVVAQPLPAPASDRWLGTRTLKASELMPFMTLNGTCPPRPSRTPMVSVIVCAYNAERTIRPCLESLCKLNYPNFEIIVVDDGSRDGTAEIAAAFSDFRLIRQPNRGLGYARNVGLQSARGEIIAYTDSDCAVDPDWLTLLVRAMLEQGSDGCGGPNYAPHEDGRIEACVAAAPGAPCPVLIGEETAEHLAGCNMAFRKEALLKIGGFDPQFTAAGDDVDVCWRMIDAGYRLGYCPAAFVWHFRRNTAKAYFAQQRGYGRAEAMLYALYPERFNILGQIKWHGTVPGLARTVPGGGSRRVNWNSPRASVPTVFDPALGVASFLPLTFEWMAACVLAAFGCFMFDVSVMPALGMLLLGPIWALHYARRAQIEKCHDGVFSRMVVAYLAWTGPLVRAIARYRAPARACAVPERAPGGGHGASISWLTRSFRLAYWSESWVTRDRLLERTAACLSRSGHPAIADSGWKDFDLEVMPRLCTRVQLRSADEGHAGGRVKTLVQARVRLSLFAMAVLGLGAGLASAASLLSTELPALAVPSLVLVFAGYVLGTMVVSGRLVCSALQSAADELGLIALPAKASRSAAAAQPADGFESRAPALELGNQGVQRG